MVDNLIIYIISVHIKTTMSELIQTIKKYINVNDDVVDGVDANDNINNTIIITFANYAYAHVVHNWAIAMQRLSINNYVIIAYDKEMYDYAIEANMNVVFIENTKASGDKSFHNLWMFRMKIFDEIIENDINFIHSDADAIWLRDPLREYFTKTSDFVFSQGTIYPYAIKQQWGFVLCCGLFAVYSNPMTKILMKEFNKNIEIHQDDQVAINDLFNQKNIRWEMNSSYPVNLSSGDTFIASDEVFTGYGSYNGEVFSVNVLPHALFQRIYIADQPAYVRHILSNKNYQSKLDMFRDTGCLFII